MGEKAQLRKRIHEVAAAKDREMAELQAFKDQHLVRVARVRAEWERRGEQWMLGLSQVGVDMLTESLRQRDEERDRRRIAEEEVRELARMLRSVDSRIGNLSERVSHMAVRHQRQREDPLALDTLGPLTSRTLPG